MAKNEQTPDQIYTRLGKWVDNRFPTASPYWRVGAFLGIAIVLPGIVEWKWLDGLLKDYGAYVGALIGLGALIWATLRAHDLRQKADSRSSDEALYHQLQFISVWLSRIEQSCVNIRHNCGEFTKPSAAVAANGDDISDFVLNSTLVLSSSLPSEAEWLSLERHIVGLPPIVQFPLAVAMRKSLDLGNAVRFVAQNVDKFGHTPEQIREIIDLSDEIERIVKHAREPITDLAHAIADQLGIPVDVLENKGDRWYAEAQKPDPERASKFQHHGS